MSTAQGARALARGCLMALAAASLCARAEEPEAAVEFDIPPQPLASALTQFSAQSGVQVVAAAAGLGSARSPGVHGRMKPLAGLDLLLRGTPYIEQSIGERTVVVTGRGAADGAPADGALAETAASAAGSAVPAEEPGPAEPAAETSQLRNVVVTGSRVRRSAEKSTAPIDVIGAEDLQANGAGTLSDALSLLLPSFNLPAVPGQDQSAIVRPANLRGLNADQMLVLVDGKRRHASAIVNANSSINKGSEPVDLNLIPLAAIDHIEVLRDGASAQYGSDAIAGVINIVLRHHDHGAEVFSRNGLYDFKDGFTSQSGAGAGFQPWTGGFLHLSGEILSQNFTNRAAQAEGPFYYPQADGSADPREATASRDRIIDGLPLTRALNLGGSAALSLPGGVELYTVSTFGARHAKGYENFRYANGDNDPPYAWNLYPDGYEPREAIHEIDFSSTLGARGPDLLGWSWDLSSTYGKDDAAVFTEHSLNATLGPDSPTRFYDGSWINAELTNDLDFSRAFDLGLAGPLHVAAGAEYRNNAYAIKPGEPDSYSTGAYTAFCAPVASSDSSDPCYPQTTKHPSPGAQSYNGFSPQRSGHAYRDNFAGYVDLEARPLRGWDIGLAARFEHYSDFGNTRTGKVSTRYQLLPRLALRGTINNGFRAPALGQSLYATSSTFFQTIDNVSTAIDVVTAPVGSDEARALGAVPLRPETSSNYSLGLVATPLPRLDLTIDAYRIYVRHRILETGILSEQLDPGIGTLLQQAGVDPTTNVQYFTNAADTRTQGLDAILNLRTGFGRWGSVRWIAEANWNQTSITRIEPNPPQLAGLAQSRPDFQLFDLAQQGYLTGGTPRSKIILGGTWAGRAWTVNLHLIRYGHVVDSSKADDGIYQEVPPAWITNLDLAWRGAHGLTLGVGADNLFNRYPPQTSLAFRGDYGPGSNYVGFNQYSGFSPYGYFGGFYYLRLQYRFDR
jgi:iron complex outermembrane receptor protein